MNKGAVCLRKDGQRFLIDGDMKRIAEFMICLFGFRQII